MLMREKIFRFIHSSVPEGEILPWWCLVARAILYPVNFFYSRIANTHGYLWEKDVWVINGIVFSSQFFRILAEAKGEVYRVKRVDDEVMFERIPESQIIKRT